MNILHITAHLGAGAGKAIVGISTILRRRHPEVNICIILLESPQKTNYVLEAEENGIAVVIEPDNMAICKEWDKSDIIIVNWWAHPKMFQVLHNMSGKEGRVILWSHFNGCQYPCLTAEFVERFFYTLFTCQYSYENENWKLTDKKRIEKESRIIYGIGDFQPEKFRKKINYNINDSFVIGYIGTVNFNKLNTDWVRAAEKITENIGNVKFVLYGDCSREFRRELEDSVIKNKTEIKGFVENVQEALLEFDMLGYPLNPITSGTTENALLEAMAVGVPCVALKQGTEKYIIINEKTGLLADNMDHYVQCVTRMENDFNLRKSIGENARNAVIAQYNGDENTDNFFWLMKELIQGKKQIFEIRDVIGNTPFEYFLSVAGIYSELFRNKNIEKTDMRVLPKMLFGKSKSSLRHFAEVYPNDNQFKYIMDEHNNEVLNE